jgi:hypothetical protein
MMKFAGLSAVKSRQSYVLVLLITVLAVLWVQWPRIRDPYQIEEDFRVLHWMHRFDDRSLFEADPTVFTRILEWEIGPWQLIMDGGSAGYSLLFQVANQFVPFLLFSKLLIFPLTLLAVTYIYGIGKRLWNTNTAVVLSLLFLVLALASSTSVSPTGGLQRSFIFPLLLGLIYHLISRQYGAVAVILIVSGLVYPAAFVLGATATMLTIVDWRHKAAKKLAVDKTGLFYLTTAVLITILALTPVIAYQVSPLDQRESAYPSGEMFQLFRVGSEAHILSNPLYQSGSRGQLFTNFPFIGRGGLATQGLSIIHIAILAVMALLTVWLNPRTIAATHSVLRRFFVSIWICFILSWLAILLTSAFPLYLPSRYTEASLFLILLIFVVGHGQTTFQQMLNHVQTQPGATAIFALLTSLGIVLFIIFIPVPQHADAVVNPKMFRTLLISLLIILWLLIIYKQRFARSLNVTVSIDPAHKKLLRVGILFVLFWVSLAYITIFQHDFYTATEVERALFAYLETQPGNIRLSGDPHTLSSIPLFAKRQVLYNCESPNFNPEVVQDSLSAYYAAPGEKQLVAAYCRKYDVDFFVVDSRTVTSQFVADRYCSFSPFDSEIVERVLTQPDFFFANLIDVDVVFQKEHLSLVACPNS